LLGAIGFSGAAWKVGPRDVWIASIIRLEMEDD